eukprot:2225948-Rhodomonas_salina.1
MITVGDVHVVVAKVLDENSKRLFVFLQSLLVFAEILVNQPDIGQTLGDVDVVVAKVLDENRQGLL